jgi:transcriptional regulator with XRE-family HTH domain
MGGRTKGAGMKTLREWRIARLMSTRTLEKAAGVTQKTIIDIEYGRRRPHYETIGKISEVLGVEPGDVTEFAAALEEMGKDAA